ncbi:MAG: hypothetical protein RL038_778 [Actinomycetota bacterium]|jgi:uncharacterized protein YlxW (UPF0749 family)
MRTPLKPHVQDLSPRARHAITIGFVTALFGLLLVVTLRGPASDELFENTTESDLVLLLDSLQQRLERLQLEEYELRNARAEILAGNEEEALARAQEQLFAMNVLNGTVPVAGPGVEVRIQSDGEVGYDTLLAVVQELRDSGAEALEINGIRLNARSYFSEEGAEIVAVNGVRIYPTYLIRAIGDPSTIETALTIPGGVADNVAELGGYLYIAKLDNLEILSLVPEEK